MIGGSRPLRFLGVVTIGWTTVRVALLWPTPELKQKSAIMQRGAAPEIGFPMTAMLAAPTGLIPLRTTGISAAWPGLTPSAVAASPRSGRWVSRRRKSDPPPVAPALATIDRLVQEEAVDAIRVMPKTRPSADPSSPLTQYASRWSGSAWLIARKAGRALPFAGQLGGSQTGARIAYLLSTRHRIAAVARVAGALAARDTQAAIGVEWQPTRAPIRLFAEQRVAIDNARGGPAAGMIAGLNPVGLTHGVTIEGYGQAGVIGRGGTERFADGAVHVARPIADIGRTRLEAGLGAWGGAQRGASRLDLGPSIAAIVPIADQRVRLTVDWRQRVAGNARPGSGLALTLGADF